MSLTIQPQVGFTSMSLKIQPQVGFTNQLLIFEAKVIFLRWKMFHVYRLDVVFYYIQREFQNANVTKRILIFMIFPFIRKTT
jgi:hypothetical protein